MTRFILALLGIAFAFTIACGGDDKKDGGGILGGGGSGGSSSRSGATNTNDPVKFSQGALVTFFNVIGGSQEPQRLIDLYLPECRTGVKASDITQVLALVKAFFPEISKLKVEDIDLANPKVERKSGEIEVTITDMSKMRVKVDGKFENAMDYFKRIGFDDPDDSPLEITDEPLLLKELDGKLYLADCSDLQDIADTGASSNSTSATPTPARGGASPTPQRTTGTATPTPQRSVAGATPTPNRTAPSIGRDITTPSRGNTPQASAPTVLAIARTTPTSAQRFTPALEKEFMDDCTGAGASTAVCRCMLDILASRYNVAQYREFEQAINRNERQAELNAIVAACVR